MILLQAQPSSIVNMILGMLPAFVIMGIFYFMLIRPEKKRKSEYDAMMATLTVNDEIITKGGIVGKIIKMEGDYMIVESDRVRLRFVKDAVFSKVDHSN